MLKRSNAGIGNICVLCLHHFQVPLSWLYRPTKFHFEIQKFLLNMLNFEKIWKCRFWSYCANMKQKIQLLQRYTDFAPLCWFSKSKYRYCHTMYLPLWKSAIKRKPPKLCVQHRYSKYYKEMKLKYTDIAQRCEIFTFCFWFACIFTKWKQKRQILQYFAL